MSNFGANHPKDMSNINDKATVSLFVNGEQAEDAMKRLSENAAALKTQLEAAMTAGDKKSAKSLQRELDKVNKELNRTESAAKGTNIVLDNLANSSIHGLRNALKYLEKELRMTKPNTEQWEDYAEKIKLVKQRLNELSVEEADTRSLWDKFKSWSQDAWPALDLFTQWGGNLFDVVRGAVDAFATMDQEMANVRKFTGMTEEQVADLNDEFKKIDTRTSREDLNKLAQEAGRLGKTSKEDILGFVRAADQINVALDDLGEGATLTLSKLTGVFGDEARFGTEQSLLKVGSVINELSQNCSASAPYLAQFASRMGGVGAQAKMTIPQIMAFGAVLGSNGQAVEASATALSQVIVRMMQEPAKYAKVAGLDVKQFSDLLKTDVNGALILFLDTLKKAGGMDVLSPMFKDMGENGSSAITALSTLATHIDKVKAQQVVANEAFNEGISVSKEFSVQNNTVQASIEKAQKALNDLRVELGERLSPMMSHLISSSSAMIRSLVSVVRFIMENKTAVIAITAAFVAYNVVLKVHSLWLAKTITAETLWASTTKMCSGLIASMRVVLAALTNGFMYFKNGLNVTYSMQERWRKSMAGMSFASWTGLILALGTAIFLLYKHFCNLAEAEKVVEKIRDDAISKMGEEKSKIDILIAAAKNERLSLEERKSAIEQLNAIIPNYNAQLDETTGKYKANKTALDDYLKSLTRKYELEGAKEKLAEIGKQKATATIDLKQAQSNYDSAVSAYENGSTHVYTTSSGAVSNTAFDYMNKASRDLTAKQAALDAVLKLEEKILDAYGTDLQKEAAAQTVPTPKNTNPTPDQNPDPNTDITPEGGYTSATLAEEERKKKEAEARRAAVKARKEFKAELDSYKAQRSASDREVLEAYKAGSIGYEEVMRRRHENEIKYYDDSLNFFRESFAKRKDSYLEDDKDYQKLLLDKEKSSEKYEQNRIALELESINRRKSSQEALAQHEYDVKSDPTINDEVALQAELYRIRRQALDDKLALYTAGSKEYADVQYEIESLEEEKELTMKKLYFKSVAALRKEYDKKSAAERYALEKKMLDALLKARIINTEQYAQYLEGLNNKFKKELPGDKSPADHSSWSNADQVQYDEDIQALEDALAQKIISQEEYNRRVANLDREAREKQFAGLKQYGGEWNAMLVDIGLSFANLFDSITKSPENLLNNISDCIGAVTSAVSAGMQIATEFAKAEAQIQTAAIEKRYDREIELAQGNSYKVAKLEKMKEKEIAKVKNEANRKAFVMQILQAVAQTAMNALTAYGSASATPVIGHILAPIAAAMAVAAGAAQIALIKKQQQASEAQGYAQGGFTRPGAVNEPAGIVHAGEWVASQKLLSNPVARPMIEALDYAQRTNTIGSLRAEDVSRSLTANNSLVRIAESDTSSALLAGAAVRMSQTADTLTQRLNEPFITVNTVTGDVGIKRAQDEYTRLMNNITPKSKRK